MCIRDSADIEAIASPIDPMTLMITVAEAAKVFLGKDAA